MSRRIARGDFIQQEYGGEQIPEFQIAQPTRRPNMERAESPWELYSSNRSAFRPPRIVTQEDADAVEIEQQATFINPLMRARMNNIAVANVSRTQSRNNSRENSRILERRQVIPQPPAEPASPSRFRGRRNQRPQQ